MSDTNEPPTTPYFPAGPPYPPGPPTAHPYPGEAPPHPEWTPVPPPWASAPTPAGRGQWPPPPGTFGGPPGGWAPVPPPGWYPTPAPRSRHRARRGVAITTCAALIAAFIGIGIGSRVRLHASRPTLGEAAATPVAPLVPVAPSDPSSGAGSTGPSTGADPTSPPSGADPTPGAGTPAPSSSTRGATSAQADAIATKVDPGVVDINTVLGFHSGAGAGTGMILTASGEILTNNHVVAGATSITATVVTTGRTYKASVVGTDPTQDIAVIQLQKASGLTPIRIGGSSAVGVGDAVVAIGNAGGVGGTPAVVTGTVQAVNQTITASDPGGANAETLSGLIQTNAPIQPGDSGGPLINTAAEVIGIDTAASTGRHFSSTASVGFAIPIARATGIAQQIESGTASSTVHIGATGFLGVAIAPADASGAQGGAGSSSGGAVVTAVQPGSPAAAAGLVAGDTITSVNGRAVSSAQALSSLTKSHHPGERIVVGWTTGSGRAHSATVTLGTGPAD